MKSLIKLLIIAIALSGALNAYASADLEVNTPGVNAIKQSMQSRYAQLAGYFASGAIGLTGDGLLAMHDAGVVPLAQRQSVQSLIAADNNDRNALYAEIAKANGHPEWQGEIRSTFAQRWIQRAQPGWWVQSDGGWKQR
jgi:uncharacterized protein YdbL (DUF1318 family)